MKSVAAQLQVNEEAAGSPSVPSPPPLLAQPSGLRLVGAGPEAEGASRRTSERHALYLSEEIRAVVHSVEGSAQVVPAQKRGASHCEPLGPVRKHVSPSLAATTQLPV